jgi:predicted nuclease of predicted toxin-antitoxin system
MKFLVDNSLSPRFAGGLRAAGHDAVHLRDLGLADAADEIVFSAAASARRVLLTQDADFGTILALGGAVYPSVVLFRRREKSTDATLALLLANLPELDPHLASGAIVVIEDTRIRIRSLPINE